MSWPSLASRLNTLPRVLAGPMLRDVTQLSVTVWFALRVPARVTLQVIAPDNTVILTGQADTCGIGRNLHIVAVTADQLTPPKTGLAENTIYRYKAIFDFKGGESQVQLAAATNSASLTYPPYDLPSFALPPRDLNHLRLMQGSCRRPYSNARDMLPHLSELIAAKADRPLERPHQLLLTGDQVYADDVSDPMRVLVTDAADTLLGWEELLSMPRHFGPMIGARDIHTPMRWAALKTTGFPSSDLRSHLMSLGEYLSMYLFVWSPELWPTTMPSTPDVQAEIRRGYRETENMLKAARQWKILDKLPEIMDVSDDADGITATLEILVAFKTTLIEVRRALANVPSYMIFDDHEITDDWNMTPKFCDDIYGSHLGKQMVQNGLIAYALCQHWGNVPALFKAPASGAPPAGARLLAMLDTANPERPESYINKASQYATRAADLRRLLAIHEPAELHASEDLAVYHDADALRYDFTVEGLGHQVIFTDTRTWRSYPPSSSQFPVYTGDPGTHLLRKFGTSDQFKEQIIEASPPTGTRLLLVVLTTNAPPGQGIRGATRHDVLTTTAKGPNQDLFEAWDIPSVSFDRLLTAITSRLPVDRSGKHTGTVVLLSGDVHHAFASRIGYRATQRYEDTTTPRRGAAATIVQLVGSGLKNGADEATIGLQEEGHFYVPHTGLGNFLRKSLTEAYVGFSFSGAAQLVGRGQFGAMILPINIVKQTIDISHGSAPWDRMKPRTVELTVAPHYRYRLDYIVPSSTTPVVQRPQLKLTSSLEANLRAMRDFDEAKQRYQRIHPKHIVGVANLCEIGITGSPQPSTITHNVLWWDEYTKGVRTTKYVVPASVSAPNDRVYGDITAEQEPNP
jgi:hypothetical protein